MKRIDHKISAVSLLRGIDKIKHRSDVMGDNENASYALAGMCMERMHYDGEREVSCCIRKARSTARAIHICSYLIILTLVVQFLIIFQSAGDIRLSSLPPHDEMPAVERKAVLVFDVEDWATGATEWMMEILDVLDRNNVSAVFNFLGEYAKKHPEHVIDAALRGHDIGLHSQHHINLSAAGVVVMDREVRECSKTLYQILGFRPYIFRAPFLEKPENYTDVLRRNNITIDLSGHEAWEPPYLMDGVMIYSSALDDWICLVRDRLEDQGFVAAVRTAADRAGALHIPLIVGFHPQIIGPKSSILEEIIMVLRDEDYTIVSISELQGLDQPVPVLRETQSRTHNYVVVPEIYIEILEGLILIGLIALAAATYIHARMRKAEEIGVTFVFLFLFLLVILYKFYLFAIPDPDPIMLFFIYSILVTSYILSRFVLAALYRQPDDAGITPSISVVIPAMNEEKCIFRTITAHLNSNYPKERLEIIIIDDGSTDNTWKEIQKALRYKKSRVDLDGLKIRAIRFSKNCGKRKAMSIGIRIARGEIVVVNDSDSIVHPDALYKIVQPFADPEVAGVAGHTDVENRDTLISRMQVVRYYIAFRIYKSAEALFGSVICLSGCFSAYRRRHLLKVLDDWEYQRFLGIPCTYGDDRGLTTCLLKEGHKTLYVPEAKATTVVPSDFKTLWRQQLRWKKSWVRETYIVSRTVLRRHPLFAMGFFVHVFLTFAGFFVALRAILLMPLLFGSLPIHYIGGLAIISILYVGYYRMNNHDGMGRYSLLWILFYVVILSWQIFLALFKLKDNRWGTREAKYRSDEIRRFSLPFVQVASA